MFAAYPGLDGLNLMTDVAHLSAVREARDRHVDTERPSARTAVQVAALVRPELLLEVEALALVAEERS